MGADITQGLESVGVGNGALGVVAPVLRTFGGFFKRGQALADEESYANAQLADQFAAMSDFEDEQFYASADSATTLPTGQSASSDEMPGWAIGLLVLGCLVIVALIIVQVQIILVLRRRLPSERTN